MRYYTHIIFALLLGLFLQDYTSITPLFYPLLLLFTLIPDIDQHKSFLGRELGFLSRIFEFIGHRTIFHSLLFIAPLTFLFWNFSHTIAYTFFLGTMSHLILDGLTPQGITPFYPFPFKIKGKIKTGSVFEKGLFFVLLVFTLVKASI